MSDLREIDVSLTPYQVRKLRTGHQVSLTAKQLKGEAASGAVKHKLKVHHETHKRLMKAKRDNKGSRLQMGQHELQQSGSLWDTIKSGLSSVWKYAKPVLSGIGDAVSYANPELVPLREGVRKLTGVGIRPAKGSQAAKDHMAKLRAMRKPKSGSFRL